MSQEFWLLEIQQMLAEEGVLEVEGEALHKGSEAMEAEEIVPRCALIVTKVVIW